MKIYLVGGALRDELLNRAIGDRDYLVVGSTPEEMIKLGYKQVGKKFPVFLHPETFEEYALARKEIKTGPGYQGFKFIFDKNITLDQDLVRRDFTINAMARCDGAIVDLFDGKKDLEQKILRHVSEHFIEDPLRIIRAMRFSAVLSFKFAPETRELLEKMITDNMLDELSQDRIFKEIEKVLVSKKILPFCKNLKRFNILNKVLPGVEILNNAREDLNKYEQLAQLYITKDSLDKLSEQYILPNKYKKMIERNIAYHKIENNAESILNFFKKIRFDSIDLLSIEKINSCTRGYSKVLNLINGLNLAHDITIEKRNSAYKEVVLRNLTF